MTGPEASLPSSAAAPRHVLVVAHGSSGDVNPMLGIATGLRRRGHEVTLIANPIFERAARAGGLGFVPLGTEESYRAFVEDPDAWRWWRCYDVAFRRGWLPFVRPVYERIAALARPRETVLVANLVALGAWLAKEKLGLPLALVAPSPLAFQSLERFPNYGPFQGAADWLGRPGRRLYYLLGDLLVDAWIGRGVNALRSELGLAPAGRIVSTWVCAADRVIGLWPEWYAGPQEGWPSRLTLAGFLNFDRDELEAGRGAEALERLEEDPPIVFTCGSALSHERRFAEVAEGVAKILARRVLLVTDRPAAGLAGLEGAAAAAGAAGAVERAAYVPFRRLLPRSRLLVHHGGIGTASAALAAGIPQVIVPLAFDQFDNTDRFAALGVARKVPRSLFQPRRAAREIERLLGSQEVADRCKRLQARVDPEGALRRACEAAEGLGDRSATRLTGA